MMRPRCSKRILWALTAAGVVSVTLVGLKRGDEDPDAGRPTRDYPALFAAPPTCLRGVPPAPRATRVEQQGHFYAERYPYDAQDGIEAVLRFQEAQRCYEDLGLGEHATRARQLAADLMARINVDYASSRLVLENALLSEKWAVALAEIHRLLRLTEHVRDHSYVDYLWSLVGKVTIRANTAR